MSASEWISIDTLAAELDVPVRTIYTWRASGRGPRAAKFGRSLRFRRTDVDAWIEQQLDACDTGSGRGAA